MRLSTAHACLIVLSMSYVAGCSTMKSSSWWPSFSFKNKPTAPASTLSNAPSASATAHAAPTVTMPPAASTGTYGGQYPGTPASGYPSSYGAVANNGAQYPTGSYPSSPAAGSYPTNAYATAANPYQANPYAQAAPAGAQYPVTSYPTTGAAGTASSPYPTTGAPAAAYAQPAAGASAYPAQPQDASYAPTQQAAPAAAAPYGETTTYTR